MQLGPLVHAARKCAKARRDPAGATVHPEVGRLRFDLVDHGLELLAHLPPLTNGARDQVRHSGHLLHQFAPLGLVREALERVVLDRLARTEKGALHTRNHHSEHGVQEPVTKPGVADKPAVVPQHHVPTPLLETKRPAQARPAVVVAGPMRKQFWKGFRDIPWRVLPYGLPGLVLHVRRIHAWVLQLPTVDRGVLIRAHAGRAWCIGWLADDIFRDVNQRILPRHCVQLRCVVARLVHVWTRAGRAWRVGWPADDLLCYICQ